MSISIPSESRVYFVFLDIRDDPVRVNSSGWPLYWEGGIGSVRYLWLGVGALGAMSGVSDDTEMSAKQMALTINDVPLSHVNAIKDDPTTYQERAVEIWQCDLSDHHQVVSSVQVWAGEMASAEVEIGSTGRITMHCEQALARWSNTKPERMNDQQHQRDYPGDRFFEYGAVCANVSIEI